MMMCKNSYEKKSDRTDKTMVFCGLKGKDGALEQLCISQKFCQKKDRYIATDQKKNCKYYE